MWHEVRSTDNQESLMVLLQVHRFCSLGSEAKYVEVLHFST